MFFLIYNLTQTVYNLLVIIGPIEISRSFMLKENRRVYAMMICTLESFRLVLQGLFFDYYVIRIITLDHRKFTIFFIFCNVFIFLLLYKIIK